MFRAFLTQPVRHSAAIALTAALFLNGCQNRQEPYLQGYVEGEYIYMAAPATGILKQLHVTRGDQVTSGALLFSMDAARETAAVAEAEMKLKQGEALLTDARLGQRPTEIDAIEAQLRQAEAALTLSSRVLERQKKLFNDKVIAAEELDRARSDASQKTQAVSAIKAQLATARQGSRENQVAAAEANVSSLQAALAQTHWNLQQTSQTAPQASTIFDTYFRAGELVSSGRPVVSLLPPENIQVRVFLAEGQVGKVSVGQHATVIVDGQTEFFNGHVSFISPQYEFTPPVIYSREMREKLSYMIEISFPPDIAAKLHPGQPVEVQISGVTP